MMGAGRAAVFVDRDGVINRMRSDYVKSWLEFEALPGAIAAMARMSAGGRDVIVLTNQSAIGRGLVSLETVEEIHRRLSALVERAGGGIRTFFICPHTPSDGCTCRKPAPGLLYQARDQMGVDLAKAIVIGDQPTDIQAARAAGCRAILVDATGEFASCERVTGCRVTASLSEAADLILGA